MVPWHSETLRRCSRQHPRLSGVISRPPPSMPRPLVRVRLYRAQLPAHLDTSRRRKCISCCDLLVTCVSAAASATLSCSPSVTVCAVREATDMCFYSGPRRNAVCVSLGWTPPPESVIWAEDLLGGVSQPRGVFLHPENRKVYLSGEGGAGRYPRGPAGLCRSPTALCMWVPDLGLAFRARP
eukprot:7384046-Prymnesium_polylepis.1